MKTGRPKASKTMPGKISAKMPKAPMPMPRGAPPMNGSMPGMMSKGGKVKAKKAKKK